MSGLLNVMFLIASVSFYYVESNNVKPPIKNTESQLSENIKSCVLNGRRVTDIIEECQDFEQITPIRLNEPYMRCCIYYDVATKLCKHKEKDKYILNLNAETNQAVICKELKNMTAEFTPEKEFEDGVKAFKELLNSSDSCTLCSIDINVCKFVLSGIYYLSNVSMSSPDKPEIFTPDTIQNRQISQFAQPLVEKAIEQSAKGTPKHVPTEKSKEQRVSSTTEATLTQSKEKHEIEPKNAEHLNAASSPNNRVVKQPSDSLPNKPKDVPQSMDEGTIEQPAQETSKDSTDKDKKTELKSSSENEATTAKINITKEEQAVQDKLEKSTTDKSKKSANSRTVPDVPNTTLKPNSEKKSDDPDDPNNVTYINDFIGDPEADRETDEQQEDIPPEVVAEDNFSAENKKTPEPEDGFVQSEDSHFFLYFLGAMAICILAYVGFHNKQKILALVLEGRRSRGGRNNRRRHTAAYRKLDSNLEEAVTSCGNSNVTQVIY